MVARLDVLNRDDTVEETPQRSGCEEPPDQSEDDTDTPGEPEVRGAGIDEVCRPSHIDAEAGDERDGDGGDDAEDVDGQGKEECEEDEPDGGEEGRQEGLIAVLEQGVVQVRQTLWREEGSQAEQDHDHDLK